jgi:hypothetical protein
MRLTTQVVLFECNSKMLSLTIIPFSFFIQETLDFIHGIGQWYGLEGPGIESRWAEIFRTYPDRLWGPPSLLYNWYRLFPGGKGGRGVMLTTHPLLVPRLRKSWAIPPLTLWVLLGLIRGFLYLFIGQWLKLVGYAHTYHRSRICRQTPTTHITSTLIHYI